MKKDQSAKLAMGHAVSNALETFTATGMPAVLATKHAALKTKIEAINAAAAAQAEPTTGKTADRESVFQDMLAAMKPVATAVTSYAGSHQLYDLGAKVHLAPSAWQRLRAIAKILFAQQVHDAAQGALASLADYNVTTEVLTALQAKIDAANEQVSAARDAIITRKVATGQLKGAVKDFDSLLRVELDPLVESIRDSHPTAHATYRAARITIVSTRSAEPAPASASVVPLAPPALATIEPAKLAA